MAAIVAPVIDVACSVMPQCHSSTPTDKTNAARTAFIFQMGALDTSDMSTICA